MTDSSSRLRERHGTPEAVWRDRQRRGEIPGWVPCHASPSDLPAVRVVPGGVLHLLAPIGSEARLLPVSQADALNVWRGGTLHVARLCRRVCERCRRGQRCHGAPWATTVGQARASACWQSVLFAGDFDAWLTLDGGTEPSPGGFAWVGTAAGCAELCGNCAGIADANIFAAKHSAALTAHAATGSTLTLREARAGQEGLWP